MCCTKKFRILYTNVGKTTIKCMNCVHWFYKFLNNIGIEKLLCFNLLVSNLLDEKWKLIVNRTKKKNGKY